MLKEWTCAGLLATSGLLLVDKTPALGQSVEVAQANPASEFYTLGVAKAAVGNYDEALEAFNRAIALDPDYVDAFVYRGFVHVMLGNDSQALADLNQAVTRSPTADVYKARAALRTRLGDHAGAVQDYDRALEVDAEDAEAYRGRAEAYRMIGAYAAADYNYTQAIAFNPSDGLVYRRRGELRLGTGDPEGALEDFTQAIALRPDDPEAYYGRAIVRSQLGDIAGAREDFQMAGDLFLLRSQPDRYRETLREINRL